MNQKCKYCLNKEQCSKCDAGWKDKFIPSEEVKGYFRYSYVGVGGLNGWTYDFDTTSESLIPTHSVLIGYDHYCPYCGEKMYSIQDKATLGVIGYCCICDGARKEIEYEKRKKELEDKHKKELNDLKNEYIDRLQFCSNKLLEIKQQEEQRRFDFFRYDYNHFSTLNGEKLTTIGQIVR